MCIFGLLLSVSFFISPAKSSGIKMLNGIGIHEFDLAETGDLTSEGFIEIENKGDEIVVITYYLSNEILDLDLGKNGEPRTHKLGLEGEQVNITFHPLPDITWIQFEQEDYTIQPYGKTKVKYELCFSREQLEQYGTENNTKGFMCYIYLKDKGGGAQINVNFRHKIFLVFEGEAEQTMELLHYLILMIFIPVSGILIVLHRKRHNKDKKVPNPKLDIITKKELKHKPKDDDLMRQRLDSMLWKDEIK